MTKKILFFLMNNFLILMINSSYNPIPIGSVIISTTRTISILQPEEYGGTDKSTTIFTAWKNMTIINTIFNPTTRDFHILFTNSTDNIIHICQLISVEKLDPVMYELPITFNITNLNKLTSFSSDINNQRLFLTDQTGNVTMFSMSGLMKTRISIPITIDNPIRSVNYNQNLNRLFLITDSIVYSCINLDQDNLQCCQTSQPTTQLRSITFDPLTSKTFAYVMDEQSGIYQVHLNTSGCPDNIRPINRVGIYHNIHLVIYQDLYFYSGSADNSNHNSILFIGNGTQNPREILFDTSIVALHISYPNLKSTSDKEEICFHGITYHDYRVAVVLAAIFGTIMGIFMCFNALFCIDFFMTKRIIRDLKKQIPHNLLEDRWNNLVQEKYAKLALERNRKKDDPLPKRKSSASARKIPTNDNNQSSSIGETIQVVNPIPKISAYLRRKSEGYLNRRRSDGYRSSADTAQIHTEGIKEEDRKELRENTSRQDLLKTRGELL